MFIITDDVTEKIDLELLAFPPERGGALLGPQGIPIVTDFILDTHAITTGASFVPSAWLTEEIQKRERVSDLEHKGIIHTHPDGFDRLSGPDHHAVACGLEANPHLSVYLCPIGTRTHDAMLIGQPRANDLWLGGGKLSFFIGRRKRPEGINISATTARILPVRQDSQRVAAYLCADSVADIGVVEIEGRQFFGRQIDLSGGIDLTLLYGIDYPVSPPIALIGQNDAGTTQLTLSWPIECTPQDRLLAALNPHFHCASSTSAGHAYRRAWGPTTSMPLTEDPEVAASANWPSVVTNIDVAEQAAAVRDKSLARTRGLLPPIIGEKSVLIGGTGSVGTYVAEQLLRSGISRFILLDPECVEWANLSRTGFRAVDVDIEKVRALTRILLNINPCACIRQHVVSIQDLGLAGLNEAVEAADMVINAADDPLAAKALSRFAYANGKPFLSIGLFAGAQGGEVIMSVPDRTPCFECATNFRRTMEQDAGSVSRGTDYGTGRLQGEVALGADVHHVASAAVKLALSLLMPNDATGALRDLAELALIAKTPYLLMGMVPNYWFFPALFRDTSGQHAYQSVWAEVKGDPACPICGLHRVDPLSVPLKSPSASAFRQALAKLPPVVRDIEGDK